MVALATVRPVWSAAGIELYRCRRNSGKPDMALVSLK